jgi:hypothetical protein
MSITSVYKRVFASGNGDDYEINLPPDALAGTLIDLSPRRETKTSFMPRASSIYTECMRRLALATLHRKSEKTSINLQQRLTFGIGDAVHSWLQNDPNVFGDRRRGWWKCLACGGIREFGPPPTKRCPDCNALPGAYQYHEGLVKGPISITGHTDMFLQKKNGILRVAEFKTISGVQFSKLLVPSIDYVWQVMTYMYAYSQSDALPCKIDTKYAYLFYFSKQHQSKTMPVRCFPIRYDPKIVKQIKQKVRLYEISVESEGKKIPKRHDDCSRNPGCYRASACIVRKECFCENKKG